MTDLRPFFSFFGGKWRIAPKYPAPRHRLLIEPFAGSAGYAVRHYTCDVRLYDADPVVCGVWDYLIHVSAKEINQLPLRFDHIDEIVAPQEAKWLIGFWINKASVAPRKVPSRWMRELPQSQPNTCWGKGVRSRLAWQVSFIRHWRVHNLSYEQVPLRTATWFIDPPYDHPSGRLYKSKVGDFDQLGQWCRGLRRQVIVCERDKASWLPFIPFVTAKALEGINGKKQSKEVVWINNTPLQIDIKINRWT